MVPKRLWCSVSPPFPKAHSAKQKREQPLAKARLLPPYFGSESRDMSFLFAGPAYCWRSPPFNRSSRSRNARASVRLRGSASPLCTAPVT